MANTFLGFTNRVDSATLLNGTGGGAPAVDETSPYGMENVINTDRYTPWQTGSTPAGPPSPLDLDLGANRTITVAAVLGYRVAEGVTGASTVDVKYATAAAGYPPAGWTDAGSITVSGAVFRDMGVVFGSISARYWRFSFNHAGNPWAVGRLWLGDPTDLGAIHSPGGQYSPFRNRLETPQPGGAVVINNLGDAGADFTLPWSAITSSLRSTLLSVQAQSGTFLLVDADQRVFEVYAPGGRVDTARRYTSLFDANLVLRAMP